MNQKIIIDKDGVGLLQGKICPFRNPLVFPTSLGSVEIQNIPCASSCALFSFHPSGDDISGTAIISCSSKPIVINVEIENQNKSKSNLIV